MKVEGLRFRKEFNLGIRGGKRSRVSYVDNLEYN